MTLKAIMLSSSSSRPPLSALGLNSPARSSGIHSALKPSKSVHPPDHSSSALRASPSPFCLDVPAGRRTSLDLGYRPAEHDAEGQPVRSFTLVSRGERTPGGSLLSGGAQRVRLPPTPSEAASPKMLGSNSLLESEAVVASSPRAPNSAIRSGARRVVVESVHAGGVFGEEDELDALLLPADPAALAFPALRAIARHQPLWQDHCPLTSGPCKFDKAPPSTGGSVIRLAAFRATASQREELSAGRGVILTPVCRTVPPQQVATAAANPTVAMLEDVGYVYAPNDKLQPEVITGGTLYAGSSSAPPCEPMADEGLPVPAATEVDMSDPSIASTAEEARTNAQQTAATSKNKRGRPAASVPVKSARRSDRLRSCH